MFNRDVFFEDHLYVVSPLTLGVDCISLVTLKSIRLAWSVAAVPFLHDLALRVVRNYRSLAIVINQGIDQSVCCWHVCSPIFAGPLNGPSGIISPVIILLVANIRNFALIAKSGHHWAPLGFFTASGQSWACNVEAWLQNSSNSNETKISAIRWLL